MPKEFYAVRWSGVMCPDKTAEYEFTLGGDDGYRMFINGETAINDWEARAYHKTNITKKLEA